MSYGDDSTARYVRSVLDDPAKRASLETELSNNWVQFRQIQARDGLPCPDTGISHCAQCHGAVTVDEWADGSPTCGHWAGCPEC